MALHDSVLRAMGRMMMEEKLMKRSLESMDKHHITTSPTTSPHHLTDHLTKPPHCTPRYVHLTGEQFGGCCNLEAAAT